MELHFLDLSSIAHPIWHQSSADPDPNATTTKTLARVRALATGKPHFAVCADSGVSFRRDLDPSYKANRPATDAALQHQLQKIQEACRADGFPVWAVKGYEADDLIGTAVRMARDVHDPNLRITVLSADKDLLQLVVDPIVRDDGAPDPSGGVNVYRTHQNGELYDAGRTFVEFGVRPDQIVDYLTLVGDATDNIKGAPGVGPKKAAELLRAFGTIEGIYTALTNQGTKFTPALASNLRAFESRVDDVRALVRLKTDAPIPFHEITVERVVPERAAPAGWATGFAADTPVVDTTAIVAEQEQADAEVRDEMASETYQDVVAEMNEITKPIEEAARTSVTSDVSAGVQKLRSADPVPVSAGPMTAPVALQRVHTPTLVPTTFERQLEPRSYQEARDLAMDLFQSQLFSAYGSPQAVISTILAGRELGMQAMASLRAFHIVDSKPTMAADAMRALVLKSGKAKTFRCTERTPTRCTYVGLRSDDPEAEPLTMSYTIEEARAAWTKSADAWDKSNWGKGPSDMLVARCSSKMARLIWPDVTFGLYDPTELEGV